MRVPVIIAISLAAAACHQAGETANVPGTSPEGFNAIAPDEVISFGGTEPFWGGTITGDELTYSTSENVGGEVVRVKRFTGQGGLGFSGGLGGRNFDLLITQGRCSDGMSDRTYPYVATLRLGEELREGCAHTDRQPYEGPARP